MRNKDQKTLKAVERFVCEFTDQRGYSPSLQEIADSVGVSKTTAYRYVDRLRQDGVVGSSGYRSLVPARVKGASIMVPVLGRVACGLPRYAEENIEEYVRMPEALIGSGEFFLLRAVGDSMVGAGINEGDLVLVKRQNTAEKGQIVVALVGEEATLKRFYPEAGKKHVRLHPENPAIKDIVVPGCDIQGVAVKVIKDLS
ncbi:repressor LexA [bacterium]|nr:repressor LexA [bacterium]